MTRENLSVGRLLNTPTTQRMSKIEFDNADYIESCMVFKNFTSLDNGRSREFVAKFNSPDEAKDFIKNYNQIYNDHEAQLKAKDEITQDIKEAYEFKSIAYDLLLEAIQLKDEEIERLKIELDNMCNGYNDPMAWKSVKDDDDVFDTFDSEEIEKLKAENSKLKAIVKGTYNETRIIN